MSVVSRDSGRRDRARGLALVLCLGMAAATIVSGQQSAADAARDYVAFVEERLGVEVCLIGTGASRERVLSPRGVEAVLG